MSSGEFGCGSHCGTTREYHQKHLHLQCIRSPRLRAGITVAGAADHWPESRAGFKAADGSAPGEIRLPCDAGIQARACGLERRGAARCRR